MSTPNNVAALPVQVLVYNSGGSPLDCSAAFESFEGGAEDWDPTGWWRFTGTLVLAARTAIAESFDPRLNPTRWSPGNLVQISVNFGAGWVPLPFRLKILGWPARPRRGEQRISLELGGDPELLSYRSPQGDAGGADYGTATDRVSLINATLTEAGASPIVSGTTPDFPLFYSPGKNSGGSWIDFAGQVAWSGNALLWQRGDGGIVCQSFSQSTITGLPPFAHYTVGVNDVRWEPQAPTEAPPEVIRCTGTGIDLTRVTNATEVSTATEDGFTTTTTTVYSGQGTANPQIRVTVTKPRFQIIQGISPSDPGGTTTEIDTRTTTTESYDSQGKLSETETVIEEMTGKIFPGYDGLDRFTVMDSQGTTTTLTYNLDGVVSEKRTVINKAKLVEIAGVPTPQYRHYQTVRENWTKRENRYTYSRSTFNADPATSAAAPRISGAAGSGVQPPATQYQPPAVTRETVDHAATVTVTNPGGAGYSGKVWQLSLPGGLCSSNANAAGVARVWALIRHGRQWPIAWAAPLTSAWLTSFSPLRRIDFTVDGTRTAYLISAWQIILNRRTARVGGSTVELGTVGSDGSGTPNPPYTIS